MMGVRGIRGIPRTKRSRILGCGSRKVAMSWSSFNKTSQHHKRLKEKEEVGKI